MQKKPLTAGVLAALLVLKAATAKANVVSPELFQHNRAAFTQLAAALKDNSTQQPFLPEVAMTAGAYGAGYFWVCGGTWLGNQQEKDGQWYSFFLIKRQCTPDVFTQHAGHTAWGFGNFTATSWVGGVTSSWSENDLVDSHKAQFFAYYPEYGVPAPVLVKVPGRVQIKPKVAGLPVEPPIIYDGRNEGYRRTDMVGTVSGPCFDADPAHDKTCDYSTDAYGRNWVRSWVPSNLRGDPAFGAPSDHLVTLYQDNPALLEWGMGNEGDCGTAFWQNHGGYWTIVGIHDGVLTNRRPDDRDAYDYIGTAERISNWASWMKSVFPGLRLYSEMSTVHEKGSLVMPVTDARDEADRRAKNEQPVVPSLEPDVVKRGVVGFYSAASNATALAPVGSPLLRGYSTMSVSGVKRAGSDKPYTIKLRAWRARGCEAGGADNLVAMNDQTPCNATQPGTSELVVKFFQRDNPGLPAGHYTGMSDTITAMNNASLSYADGYYANTFHIRVDLNLQPRAADRPYTGTYFFANNDRYLRYDSSNHSINKDALDGQGRVIWKTVARWWLHNGGQDGRNLAAVGSWARGQVLYFFTKDHNYYRYSMATRTAPGRVPMTEYWNPLLNQVWGQRQLVGVLNFERDKTRSDYLYFIWDDGSYTQYNNYSDTLVENPQASSIDVTSRYRWPITHLFPGLASYFDAASQHAKITALATIDHDGTVYAFLNDHTYVTVDEKTGQLLDPIPLADVDQFGIAPLLQEGQLSAVVSQNW